MKKYFLSSVICFSVLSLLLSPSSAASADYAAVLYKVSGTVEFSPASRPLWKKAKLGMGLAEKDRIRTGLKASAQILLDDGSFYVIREKCEIEIEELVRNRKTQTQQSSFKITRGTLLAQVQKLSGGSMAEFRSPTALVAVRGTDLAIDVDEDETTRVALYDGRIVVTDFAEDRFVPREQDELLLEMLHEVSLKADQITTVTKKGIAKPRALEGKMKSLGTEFPSIKAESEKAGAAQSQTTYADAQSAREKARQDALQAPE